MIFETEDDHRRERKAIDRFVALFDGSYSKLDQFDVDYKVFDKDKKLIAYVEVKGRVRIMRDAYPLPISAKKLVKLADKRLNPVLIWSCEDGIIYGKANELYGTLKYGGRQGREGASNDGELMVYYEKQRSLKYVRFS
jgi:hypothetical protein